MSGSLESLEIVWSFECFRNFVWKMSGNLYFIKNKKGSMNPVLLKCLSFTSFHISFCSVFDHYVKKV